MKLIDIISERGIILNHQLRKDESIWNSVYDLLGTSASFSIDSLDFQKHLETMDVLQSEISPKSVCCIMKTEAASKIAVIFVRLRKDLLASNGEPVKLICFVVLNNQIKEQVILSGEIIHLFRTFDLEKLLSNSRDSLHAFHLLKRFAMKSVAETDLYGGFSIYGPESTD